MNTLKINYEARSAEAAPLLKDLPPGTVCLVQGVRGPNLFLVIDKAPPGTLLTPAVLLRDAGLGGYTMSYFGPETRARALGATLHVHDVIENGETK